MISSASPECRTDAVHTRRHERSPSPVAQIVAAAPAARALSAAHPHTPTSEPR